MEKKICLGSRIGQTQPALSNVYGTLSALGGEDAIKRRYPELYKAVLNSQKHLARNAALRRAGGSSKDYIFGTSDSCKIRTVNYSPDTTLQTSSSIITDKPVVTAAIIGDISDVVTGKVIDGFAISDNNTDSVFEQSITDASVFKAGASQKFLAKSSFVVVEYDASGNPVVKTLDSTLEAPKVINGKTIVKKLTVNDPMPIKHPGAEKTNVYYNRNGDGDYCYSNVKFGSDSIDVHMPFSGSVEFDGIFQPSPENTVITDGEKQILLQIENVNNGAANFDLEYWSDVKLEVSGSVLKWEFPDSWHDVIEKYRLYCANNMNFYCRMFINTTIGIAVPITIQSKGGEHEDPSYKKIPFIDISWGCFAKDARVRMADGSEKYIADICSGDKVATKDNGSQTVRDVVTGHEERLVYIETSRASSIRVTEDHPMLTADGMVKAGELTAASILITPDGESSIESLYYEPYNDKVYNLMLEKQSLLVVNGLYAGDMAYQNQCSPGLTKQEPHKLLEIQEELADLVNGINKQKKENI